MDEATKPRPYDLSDPAERDRLLRKTIGYAQVSLYQRDGTDLAGRQFALDALRAAYAAGLKLVLSVNEAP